MTRSFSLFIYLKVTADFTCYALSFSPKFHYGGISFMCLILGLILFGLHAEVNYDLLRNLFEKIAAKFYQWAYVLNVCIDERNLLPGPKGVRWLEP